jgi:hypothetical protein
MVYQHSHLFGNPYHFAFHCGFQQIQRSPICDYLYVTGLYVQGAYQTLKLAKEIGATAF